MTEAEWFGEVMAVFHGDGGHYLNEQGPEKAAKDAMTRYHSLQGEVSALTDENERLRSTLAWINRMCEACGDVPWANVIGSEVKQALTPNLTTKYPEGYAPHHGRSFK